MANTTTALQLSLEKSRPLLNQLSTRGTQKVKYNGESDWDFHLDAGQKAIDLSLIMPHYRARNQPVEHRMSMSIANDAAPIKLKVCRNYQRSKFCLEVIADTSDVTIWLPSDFKGQIHYGGRPTFSAGFVNRIMRNVRLTERMAEPSFNEDDVVVMTEGHVTFRMWDVQTCAPEVAHKECLQRLFGCKRKAPETTIDWDFLLKD
ncbi:hypothetical protein HYPSUDRAFT_167290 [Hypholoma sublateritium FD-334 SS-4]|uniref:DUF7330 domain-containing protein n=1 Tax=Hypholoma sublateritium (strain FD-334 SS-4) TaxID=945553 RepID=A0A0D2NN81_HYPSF|nr:hypothetical protein HYPSUDRAFT_167290 [Hypholoma sublateritium FD-334 SS-4]